MPSVTVPPGAAYELTIPILAILAPARGRAPIALPPGEYEVRLSTEIQVLVGEADGPWQNVVPLKIRAIAVASGVKN